MQRHHTENALNAATQLGRSCDRVQRGLLQRILIRVDESIRLSTDTNTTVQGALASTRLSWLYQLGPDLMAMMSKVQSTVFRTYSTVLSINDRLVSLSSQIILGQVPCILMDAIGRRTPLDLQFINSWEAFDAALEVRFRNLPGHEKVCRTEFTLVDVHSGKQIDRSRPWDGAIISGQYLRMEILLKVLGRFNSSDHYEHARLRKGNVQSFSTAAVRTFTTSCPDIGDTRFPWVRIAWSHPSADTHDHPHGDSALVLVDSNDDPDEFTHIRLSFEDIPPFEPCQAKGDDKGDERCSEDYSRVDGSSSNFIARTMVFSMEEVNTASKSSKGYLGEQSKYLAQPRVRDKMETRNTRNSNSDALHPHYEELFRSWYCSSCGDGPWPSGEEQCCSCGAYF